MEMHTIRINKSVNYGSIFSLLFMMLIAPFSYSQDLNKHKWESRLILVLTNDTSETEYQEQLKEFKKNSEGMKDRRLLVYQITPANYKLGIDKGKWKKSETIYHQYKKTDSHPEILLIGLDGGVKLQVSDFLSCEKLFATIDVMPMRREELNRKENSK